MDFSDESGGKRDGGTSYVIKNLKTFYFSKIRANSKISLSLDPSTRTIVFETFSVASSALGIQSSFRIILFYGFQ